MSLDFAPGLYKSTRTDEPVLALWTARLVEGKRDYHVILWDPLSFELSVVRGNVFFGKVVVASGRRVSRYVMLCALEALTAGKLEELLGPYMTWEQSFVKDTRAARFKGLLLAARMVGHGT